MKAGSGIPRHYRIILALAITVMVGEFILFETLLSRSIMADVPVLKHSLELSLLPVVFLALLLTFTIWRIRTDIGHNQQDALREKEKADQAQKALLITKEELSHTNELLTNAIDSMAHGFAIWDKELKIVMVNEAFRQFHCPISDQIQPGLCKTDLLRIGYGANIWETGEATLESWVEQKFGPHYGEMGGQVELAFTNGTRCLLSWTHQPNGNIVSTLFDVTAQREKEEELRRTRDALKHVAYFDALTSLPNRAHGQQDLEALFQNGDQESFALIQIDLDKFKRVNDTIGHAAGDCLLKAIGSRLAFLSSQIPQFKPYRWGGDEFVAVVQNMSKEDLEDLCGELTDALSIPVTYEHSTIWPTVSLGIALYPNHAQDLEQLMICADLALYRTKEIGRDGYCFFTSDMKEKVDSDIQIETDMRSALKLDQFELYFQPQIRTSDEAITGIEALVRWNHPEKGPQPPSVFLEVVEQHGLASSLGRAIFDKAMYAARQWLDAGLDFGRLAINLSPAHLRKQTLVDDFCDSVKKHDINPDLLAVELLESVLLDDEAAKVRDIFGRISAAGVNVELDDFGTGYASLAHLTSLPVDGIKIDRSFVQNISNCEKQKAILDVVMTMSRLMQLRVVCEGIETYDQLATVSQIANCSIQGFLVSKPMTFDAMTGWMREKRNVGLLTTPSLSDIDQSRAPQTQG